MKLKTVFLIIVSLRGRLRAPFRKKREYYITKIIFSSKFENSKIERFTIPRIQRFAGLNVKRVKPF